MSCKIVETSVLMSSADNSHRCKLVTVCFLTSIIRCFACLWLRLNHCDLKKRFFCIAHFIHSIFSERELAFSFDVVVRPSDRLSSVTFVRPTQAIEIFGNVSMQFCTLAIR